jgi:hypothetical protein
MSVLKLIIGFVVGLFACAILLGLISIRSPILANSETIATQKVAQVKVETNVSGEQKVNISLTDTDKEQIVKDEPAVTTPDVADVVEPVTTLVNDLPTKPAIVTEDTFDVVKPQTDAVDLATIQDEPEPITPAVVEQVPATVLKRAGNVLTLGSGSSRLPSVSETNEIADIAENAPAEAVSVFVENSNPLVTLDTPFLSIILVDIGSAGVSQADLLRQTLPMSFAVDGSRSDAARVAGDYRAAGFETVAMLNADEVEGLKTPDAVAQVAQAYLRSMPMALAIVDAPAARLQKNSRLFGSLLASVINDPPGVLTYKGGLNTAAKATQDVGLPTGMITRYLDETYESPSIIKRAIDRTTIEAAKNGAAILMAVATPAVLQGIEQWANSSAASKVELVPVSSSMTRQKK